MNPQFPLLRPSPMEIGDLFAGTFNVFGKKWTSLLGIAALTVLAQVTGYVVMVLGVVAVLWAPLARDETPGARSVVTAVVIGVVGFALFIGLVLKSEVLMIAAARDAAADGRPTFSSTWRATSGTVRRLVLGGLVVILVVLVLYALLAGVLVAIILLLRDGLGSAGPVFGMLVLLIPVAWVGSIYLSVRLLHTLPVVTLEGVGLLDAMKRSWHLTSGGFWRTLGAILLFSLALGLPLQLVSLLASTALDSSGAEVVGLLLAAMLLAAAFVYYILYTIYRTTMYVDAVQSNREWVPMPAHLGGDQAWSEYPQASEVTDPGWGQTQQEWEQQQWSQQWTPHQWEQRQWDQQQWRQPQPWEQTPEAWQPPQQGQPQAPSDPQQTWGQPQTWDQQQTWGKPQTWDQQQGPDSGDNEPNHPGRG